MQKYAVRLFYRIGSNLNRSILIAAVAIAALLLFHSTTYYDKLYYSVRDSDPDRGASLVKWDVFGDKYTQTVYLDQGWTPVDSLWFYNTTQGSDLLPYDFFLHLEQVDSQELLRSNENMNRFRYLPQRATPSNPDGLPVGFVADTYKCKKYLGLTCAACHTSQVNYNGTGMRIDGGPGAADMDSFMNALYASMKKTLDDSDKRKRFIAAVLNSGNYSSQTDIENDLRTYTLRMEAYNFFNDSFLLEKDGSMTPVPYGYARLDAFGRIYNRVAEHVVNAEVMREVLAETLPPRETTALLERMKPVFSAQNRDHLLERLSGIFTVEHRRIIRNRVFNSPNAPVSYPFLWDIPRHDYVQWNGIGGNAGVGPIGRNAGEVIGVFATLDWEEKPGWTVSSVIGGQGFGDKHTSFQSSANVHNLRQLEDRLWYLQSPSWNDAVMKAKLPPIDETRRARGEKLFTTHCISCHANIERTSENRRIVAHMDAVSEIGTDKGMAANSVDYFGYSGILRNLYTGTEVGGILLNTRAPVAAILTTATENVVATPDPDKWFFTRAAEWLVDLAHEYFENKIKPSVKAGNYSPDTTARPFESLRAYKGRALNGIWATAPYLHNGSVPTLYDLLLPSEPKAGDPPDMKYRPKVFRVGSRELDTKFVGFKSGVDEYKDGFLFDTSKFANSNKGHEGYGDRSMNHEDRLDLVEYLKSL